MKDMDEVDKKILRMLRVDGRLPVAEMARQIGLSRVAVRERLLNLMEKGVIEDLVAIVSSAALGYTISAFLDVEIEPDKLESICQQLMPLEQISIIYQMTGASSLHIHAYARDTDDLSNLLTKHVYVTPGVVRVTTNLLLRRFKSNLSIR